MPPQVDPSEFFSDARPSLKRNIVIMGADTLRPPPTRAAAAPVGCSSTREAPVDGEVRWLLHWLGASDPFLDDDYTRSANRYLYMDGFESERVSHRESGKVMRAKGRNNPRGWGEGRQEKERVLEEGEKGLEDGAAALSEKGGECEEEFDE